MENIDSLLRSGLSSGGSSNNFMFILLLIIPIGLVIFMIFKKKNNGDQSKKNGNQLKNKQQEDEVWLTIKRFLRDSNEIGKEVVDSYVIKRPDPRARTKEKKLADKQFRELKKTNPEEYTKQKELRKIENRKKPRELYVVLFTTKNTKTHEKDKPRAIECEVIYKKVDKNAPKRTILINNLLDYEKEMEWIQPIKAKDDKELARQLRVEQRRQQRRKQKQMKKNNKEANEKNNKEKVK